MEVTKFKRKNEEICENAQKESKMEKKLKSVEIATSESGEDYVDTSEDDGDQSESLQSSGSSFFDTSEAAIRDVGEEQTIAAKIGNELKACLKKNDSSCVVGNAECSTATGCIQSDEKRSFDLYSPKPDFESIVPGGHNSSKAGVIVKLHNGDFFMNALYSAKSKTNISKIEKPTFSSINLLSKENLAMLNSQNKNPSCLPSETFKLNKQFQFNRVEHDMNCKDFSKRIKAGGLLPFTAKLEIRENFVMSRNLLDKKLPQLTQFDQQNIFPVEDYNKFRESPTKSDTTCESSSSNNSPGDVIKNGGQLGKIRFSFRHTNLSKTFSFPQSMDNLDQIINYKYPPNKQNNC